MIKVYDYEKLFDYILNNPNISLDKSQSILIALRNQTQTEKKNAYFKLLKKETNMLIESFKNSNETFNNNTPTFILENEECINVAINRDINSIKYITTNNLSKPLKEKIIKLARDNNYIITENSLDFLKSDYLIVLNSIKNDYTSIDNINWSYFEHDNDEKLNNLINAVLESNYVLTEKSANLLTSNPKVVFNSIKKDYQSIKNAKIKLEDNPEILKYLFINTPLWDEFKEFFYGIPLYSFIDREIFLKIITKMHYNTISKDYTDNVALYLNRLSDLFYEAFTHKPKIVDFENQYDYFAEKAWESYKEKNTYYYTNIFGKICIALKKNQKIDKAFNELRFLFEVRETLTIDQYYLLTTAMNNYFNIVHNEKADMSIKEATNIISTMAAKYISISKENYKKKYINKKHEDIKLVFIPKKDNPFIKKRIITAIQKQKLRYLINDQSNEEINKFKKSIIDKYTYEYDGNAHQEANRQTIKNIFYSFINSDKNIKLNSIKSPPSEFYTYKKYVEASKLIKRLNLGYIKYTDQELANYRNVISCSQHEKKYYYSGKILEHNKVMTIHKYEKLIEVYEKMKKEIIDYARKFTVTDEDITTEWLTKIANTIPFNDNYYEINMNDWAYFHVINLQKCMANSLLKPAIIMNDENYQITKDYIINNGIEWQLLYGICLDTVMVKTILNNMDKYITLAKIFNYDPTKYKDIQVLYEISKNATLEDMAILEADIIKKLSTSTSFTSKDIKNIIKIAKELVCQVAKRNDSTVPFISGKTSNYKYSIYDPQDEEVLLTGINTDACFKVNGTDNDFLHYCLLDKNGFIIKITDKSDTFIARAAGFRNGNSIYINQLRTIYDLGGNNYRGGIETEKDEIIKAFCNACYDIILTSQKNAEEADKIDFAFVTKSYILKELKTNVTGELDNVIDDFPVENKSEDWANFVYNTLNLEDTLNISDSFSLDYDIYDLLCIASSKDKRDPIPKSSEIVNKDVKAVYQRPRNKIIKATNKDIKAINKVNKIAAIYSFFNNTTFFPISIHNNDIIYVGDNWYLIINNNFIIDSCLLDFDNRAKEEYDTIVNEILKDINNHKALTKERKK